MLKFVEHRIADRRILRLIKKWLEGRGLGRGRVVEDRGRYTARLGAAEAAGSSPVVPAILFNIPERCAASEVTIKLIAYVYT